MRRDTISRAFLLAGLLAIGQAPARAADSWGLENEKAVAMEATVVDLLCALTGDCPADCGGGKRQLGLITLEGVLYPVVKGNTLFANAHIDLLPYCNQGVLTDGLFIDSPAMPAYFVQSVRASEALDWRPTTAFEEAWRQEHGAAEEWWRADPLTREVIAEDGVYGIEGLEAAP